MNDSEGLHVYHSCLVLMHFKKLFLVFNARIIITIEAALLCKGFALGSLDEIYINSEY